LLRIRLTPEEWNKRLEERIDEAGVRDAKRLYDLLKATRIPRDTLLHNVEATLGAQYVRMGNTAKARSNLRDACEFFEACGFAPATEVQLLVLSAETDRYDGRYDAAREKLETAASRYESARLDDKNLQLWIEVHRGRLAAARGRFAEAEDRFKLAIEEADEAGADAADAGSLARLGLAMLYKGFGRLEDAARCIQMIKGVTAPGPADRDDAALARYRVALAGILILEAQGKLVKRSDDPSQRTNGNEVFEEKSRDAKRALEAGVAPGALQRAFDRDDPLEREVAHLKAMLAFLRYKARPFQDLGAEEAAESAKNQWKGLQEVQRQKGDRFGEARTNLHLSQLYLLRWQRQALRNVRDDLDKYARDLAGYQAQLAKLTTADRKYREDYDRWKAAAVPDDESFRALKKRWDGLNSEHQSLKKKWPDLQAAGAGLEKEYEALLTAGIPCAPLSSAGASHTPASSVVKPDDLDRADESAGLAADSLAGSPLYPSLRCLALCQRASVLWARLRWYPPADKDDREHLDETAGKCPEEAVSLLEMPRLSLTEGDIARVEFFSQYSQAFDQLIEWHRLHNRPVPALAYAELCRSRSLYDWLCSNGGGPQGRELDNWRKELYQKARHWNGPETPTKGGWPADRGEQQRARDTFNAAQRSYNDREQEIIGQSAAGRAGFGKVLQVSGMENVLRPVLERKDLVIYYHLGVTNSYLFVLGLDSQPRIVRLQSDVLGAEPTRNVSAKQVETWVARYFDLLSKPGRFAAASKSERHLLALITDRLLPPKERCELIAAMEKRRLPLIVSAAGALQQVPFDALWVQDGKGQSFLIERLPSAGITYIPSLMILDKQERPEPPPAVPTVVTVACGNFSAEQAAARSAAASGLPNLPGAGPESNMVAGVFSKTFGQGTAKQLLEAEATKEAFRLAIDELRPACVHLATHSVPHGKLTDALVLGPGGAAKGAPDARLLTVGEIYNLPLTDCRLAVLSACRTNRDRGSPIAGEMEMSLARAFLVAGARRVVASQWEVGDQAACECIKSFLTEVARRWKTGACDYAAAMMAARNALRKSDPDNPFYWAPFILIGPACDVTSGIPRR
jgi:CHAT domain-containing protein/predicted  nucleic acid-binding Zn-ribbon protein